MGRRQRIKPLKYFFIELCELKYLLHIQMCLRSKLNLMAIIQYVLHARILVVHLANRKFQTGMVRWDILIHGPIELEHNLGINIMGRFWIKLLGTSSLALLTLTNMWFLKFQTGVCLYQDLGTEFRPSFM